MVKPLDPSTIILGCTDVYTPKLTLPNGLCHAFLFRDSDRWLVSCTRPPGFHAGAGIEVDEESRELIFRLGR